MGAPQQLAKLRSLGYVGGGTAASTGGAKPPGKDEAQEKGKKEPPNQAQPDRPGRQGGRVQRDADLGPGRGPGGPGGGLMEGDWMHVNSVTYNAKLDQIMISVHEFSEVW